MYINHSFSLRLLCVVIISFLSTVNYAKALSGLVERDEGEEILKRLRESKITLSTNLASSQERARGIRTPFLCKVMELKKEKALEAWVTYYQDYPDSAVLNMTSARGSSSPLDQLTPLQWAVKGRWNEGVGRLLTLDPDTAGIVEFARGFYTFDTPDEMAVRFIRIMGEYSVQKIIQQSPAGHTLMQSLLTCTSHPIYEPLRQRGQERIVSVVCAGVQSLIVSRLQGDFLEDALSSSFASSTEMVWSVYARSEFESLWKIPSLRGNKIWQEIPWQLSLKNIPPDAEKGLYVLKALQQWVGVGAREYFKKHLSFSTPIFTGDILPLSYAARQGMSHMLELFISEGASVWERDSLKNTSLHHAVMAHKANAVRLLTSHVKAHEGLQRCIELITALNQDNLSPMDLAIRELCLVDDPDKASIREIYDVLSSIREEGDRGEGREQRHHLQADANLKGFYEGFQRQMNIMLLAHQVIQTGLVERASGTASLLEQGIMLAGENIPFPGVMLASRLLSKAVGVYRQGRQDDRTQTLAGLFVSPTATSDAVETLSRNLTLSYEDPLKMLTNESIDPFAQSLVKRVLTYWSEYEGLPGIDEATNIKLYLSTDETGLKRMIESLRERIPNFVRTYVLKDTLLKVTGSGKAVSDRQFLMGIGICENYPSDSGTRYVRMQNPTTPHVPFGYRLGIRDEAERLCFFEVRVMEGPSRREEYVSLGNTLGALPTDSYTMGAVGRDLAKSAAGVVVGDVAGVIETAVIQPFAQTSPTEGISKRIKIGVDGLGAEVEAISVDVGAAAPGTSKKCSCCVVS